MMGISSLFPLKSLWGSYSKSAVIAGTVTVTVTVLGMTNKRKHIRRIVIWDA